MTKIKLAGYKYKRYKYGSANGFQGWVEDKSGKCIGFVEDSGEISDWNNAMDKTKKIGLKKFNPSKRFQ